MNYKYLIRLICYALTLVLVFQLFSSAPLKSYVLSIKYPSTSVVATDILYVDEENENEDPQDITKTKQLSDQIKEIADQVDQKPIDARIDKVWKAIPGYNGLKVNQEESLLIAQQFGRVLIENLVIDEIEPDVSLHDLPPSPIYRGNEKKPMVALMINVSWGTEYVEGLLSVLDEYGVKATFFLDGNWIKRNRDVAISIKNNGHEIGNHAYSHPDMTKISLDKIHDEIANTEKLIEDIGAKSHLFAPPAGAYDDRVVKVANEYNMRTILWTLDTIDWKKPTADQIVNRIVPKLENGALILMHPTESTVEALPRMIEGAQEKGLTIGTVSEVISPERTLSVVRID